MATLLDMLTDLRERLNDDGDTQISRAIKVRYLNHGIRATWPRLYRTARDTTLVLASDTFEYAVPASVGSNTKLVRVEVEDGVASGRYHILETYRTLPGLTDPIIELEGLRLPGGGAGARLRITAAKPLTALVNDGDTYDGPAQTEELPVLYALGLALSRRLDDRLDIRRLSVTTGFNGVGTDQIISSSQLAFAQFELLLDRFSMPLLPVQG